MVPFEFDGNWNSDYQFEAFIGLQSRRGSYTSKSSDEVSDGTVSLIINDDTSESPDPNKEQIEAINYLINNPALIRETMRKGVASIYEDLKIQYGYQEGDVESLQWFPVVKKLSDYDNVFGVGNVFVQLPSKNGCAYIGIECGCSWDDEHGLGFLLHKNRLVSIGAADEAFNWKGYKDNGTLETVLKNQKIKKQPRKYKPHPKYNKLKPTQKSANEAYESNLIRSGYNNIFIEEIERGQIDINGKYERVDQTFLELALSSKNTEIAEYLLKKGAKIRYSFHKVNKDIVMIDLLLKYGGYLNSKNKGGNTIVYQNTLALVTLYDHRNQSIKYGSGHEDELSSKILDLKIHLKELMNRGANLRIKNSYGFDCFSASRNLPKDQQNEISDFFNEIENFNRKKKADSTRTKPQDISKKKWWKF